jgi:hypothetical protein
LLFIVKPHLAPLARGFFFACVRAFHLSSDNTNRIRKAKPEHSLLTASPDAETDIALIAVADEGAIESKLIAILGVETDTAAELGGQNEK